MRRMPNFVRVLCSFPQMANCVGIRSLFSKNFFAGNGLLFSESLCISELCILKAGNAHSLCRFLFGGSKILKCGVIMVL